MKKLFTEDEVANILSQIYNHDNDRLYDYKELVYDLSQKLNFDIIYNDKTHFLDIKPKNK